MKPVPIANYLDHIGRVAGEKPSPPRDAAPFRPRSLQSLQTLEPRTQSAYERAGVAAGVLKPEARERTQRPVWERKLPPAGALELESLAAREAAKVEEMRLRLEEAYARGVDDGAKRGRSEAEERFAAERDALREGAVMERLEFQLGEYAELEAAIRAGFAEVEARVGAAVARLLAPFLMKEVVKSAVDELQKAIGRLAAGGSTGLITIRGPARVLSRLRDRVADLPVGVEFVETSAVEASVECNATRIATELEPWAELLATFET